MVVHLCIPHPPVPLPGGGIVSRGIVARLRLRWSNHHPLSLGGIGVLLDADGQLFDGRMYGHLRSTVGAWLDLADESRVRGALGLSPDEPIGPLGAGPLLADLTVLQAAEELGVTDGRVRQLLGEGRLPGASKVGRDWLIPRVDVEAAKQRRDGRRQTRDII